MADTKHEIENSRQSDPLWEATEMDRLDEREKARRALLHLLTQIRTRPEVGYELGIGTQTFGMVTEAYAALSGRSVRSVRESYYCPDAERPGQADADRLDWLQEALGEAPREISDALGLPDRWTDLRRAVDEARRD